MKAIRSAFSIVAGLFVLSFFVEGIEWGIVTMLHGGPTSDPAVYFGVRNQPAVLCAKLIYNTAAAWLAGLVAGRLAPDRPWGHGIALAVTQTTLFVWGMLYSDFAGTTPRWAWITLLPLMVAAIMGGVLSSIRRTRSTEPDTLL